MSWREYLAGSAQVTVPTREIVGKQRPRMNCRNCRTYTPTKTLRAEQEVRDAWRAAYGDTFARHDGPVRVRISTYRPLAKSNPKFWEGRADTGKPDWDNVGKLVCDALNGIAYRDDQQVVSCTVTKRPRPRHGEQPRISIYIEYFAEEYEKEEK